MGYKKTPRTHVSIPETEVRWIAGTVEGEGSSLKIQRGKSDAPQAEVEDRF